MIKSEHKTVSKENQNQKLTKKKNAFWPKHNLFRHFSQKNVTENNVASDKNDNYDPGNKLPEENWNMGLESLNSSKDLVSHKEDVYFGKLEVECENSEEDTEDYLSVDLAKSVSKTVSKENASEIITKKKQMYWPKVKLPCHFSKKNKIENSFPCDIKETPVNTLFKKKVKIHPESLKINVFANFLKQNDRKQYMKLTE